MLGDLCAKDSHKVFEGNIKGIEVPHGTHNIIIEHWIGIRKTIYNKTFISSQTVRTTTVISTHDSSTQQIRVLYR